MPNAIGSFLRFVAVIPLSLAAQESAGERGLDAFRSGRLVEAETLFRQAVGQAPENLQWLKWLGMALAAQEKYRDAEPLFDRICRRAPEDPDGCYYLGRARFSIGRFAEARSAFDTALARDKRLGRTWHGLALTLERTGEGRRADDAYRRALQLGHAPAGADYGLFLAAAGRFDEAIEILSKTGATAELVRVRRQADAVRPASLTEPVSVSFRASKLPRSTRNGAVGRKRLPETMLGGVAIFDFNNDGLPDIFLTNGGALPNGAKPDASFHNALFRNRGANGFEDETVKAGLTGTGYAMGAAAADFDQDGYCDLFVAGLYGSQLYRNNGNGTFADVTRQAELPEASPWSISAVWTDYDRDGWPDLFVVRYVHWNADSEPECRDAGHLTYCHPSHYQPLANVLYRNLGNGTFQDVSQAAGISVHSGKGMGAAVGDVDGDGWPDVFVANDTTPNFLFRNRGDGRFSESALDMGVALKDDGRIVSSMGAAFADLNNDGEDELFVSALSDETFLLFQAMMPGQFQDARLASRIGPLSQPFTGWGVAAADFNNDGFKDLIAAGGHVQDNAEQLGSRKSRQPVLVFLNRGDGTFVRQEVAPAAFYRGLSIADLNADGRMDAVVTRLNEPVLILWNETRAPDTSWIAFRLQDRHALGARMRLETTNGAQYGRMAPNQGYASSQDHVIHFGIPAGATLKSALIEWADGVSESWNELATGRVHTVRRRSTK